MVRRYKLTGSLVRYFCGKVYGMIHSGGKHSVALLRKTFPPHLGFESRFAYSEVSQKLRRTSAHSQKRDNRKFRCDKTCVILPPSNRQRKL